MNQPANPHAVSKHTLTLLNPLYAALKQSAENEGLEANEVIVRLIEDYVVSQGTLDAYTARRVELRRKLIKEVVKAAVAIRDEGKFAESITLDAISKCLKDDTWKSAYREYVEDDIFKGGNPLKGPINREIGFRIRAALDAEVLKEGSGKPRNEKVTGSIIQSYTPLKLAA